MKTLFKGFSLIELLVSISIISILISAALFILRPLDYIKRSRDSRRQSDLKVIQTSLEQYYANNSAYPPIPPGVGSFTFGSSWSTVTPPVTYLRLVPNDPDSTKAYCYNNTSPNYLLCANLENPPVGLSNTCSATTYNYCLANPF